ncbi:MAG: phenylalanine--tRNA ligase subunit alpha [Candidatus Geothermarchaeota archaeon]
MITEETVNVLKVIKDRKAITIEQLSKEVNINEDTLRGLIETLRVSGAVNVKKMVKKRVYAGSRIKEIGDLPEKIILERLVKLEGKIATIDYILNSLGLSKDDAKAGLNRLITNGLAKVIKENGRVLVRLLVEEVPKDYIEASRFLNKLLTSDGVDYELLSEHELKLLNQLSKRPEFIEVKEKTIEYVEYTPKIDELLNKVVGKKLITKLDPQIIASRTWDEYVFKSYDVSSKFYNVYFGRTHPLRDLIREITEIYESMGFEEADGPLVEIAFRNFDMLFQPQDHPARDMQDTFYLMNPEYGEIEYDHQLIERVKRTHENGWITGSKGWGKKWDMDEARKLVLRTHMTAVTIRKVYEIGEREAKVFAIGRTFRNESVDYKHLAEFMQVDGIIISKRGNLRMLMGVLQEFYKRLGFNNVKFWPSYFPYTEPSLQPSVYVEKWDKWIELGGAGIFRPEVTIPLGVSYPVLAWGLGIERILMVRYNIDDIRQIYANRLSWLRGLKACLL